MRVRLDHSPSRLEARGGPGGGGLSKNTIIIIAAVGGCVGLIALIVLWNLCRRCCRRSKKVVPLPPVQDLAHRREQQLAAYSERHPSNAPSSWLGVSGSSGHPLSETSSSVSLLTIPEKNGSVYIDDGATAESATLASPASDKVPLHPPNPMFYPPPLGSSPHASLVSTTSGDSSYSSLPGATGMSHSPSAPGSDTASFSMSAEGASPRRSRSQARAGSRNDRTSFRGRPQSQISLRSNHSGKTARSNVSTSRGAPHGPFNNVQIVLPAPLGAQPLPQQVMQRSSLYGTGPRTSGFADQWVMAGQRMSTVPEQSTRKSSSSNSSSRDNRRSSSTPASRSREPSTSSSSSRRRSAMSPPPSGTNRRSASQHAPSSSSLRNEVRRSPPASPGIARTYNGLADLAESSFEAPEYTKDHGRGHHAPQPPPPSGAPPHPQRSSASKDRASDSTSRPRSQSQPKPTKKLTKQRDPVR